MATFGCLGLPQLPVVVNLLVPRDLEALEVHRGQTAAAVRACSALHTRMLSIAAVNTVDAVDVDTNSSATFSFYRLVWSNVTGILNILMSVMMQEMKVLCIVTLRV